MRQGWSWVDGRNHKDQPSITPHFQKVFLPHPVVNWTVDKPGCLPAQQEGRVLPQSQTAKKNNSHQHLALLMAWTGLSCSFTLWRCALLPGEARFSHRLSTRGIPLTPTESEQQDAQREWERCKAVKPLDKSCCKGIWQIPLLHLAPAQKTKAC